MASHSSERTPLLTDQTGSRPGSTPPKPMLTDARTLHKVRIFAVVLGIVTLFNIGSAVFQIPLNGLLEERLCMGMYPDRPYDPDFCKSDSAVSSMQTFIDGWSGTFGLLPALIFSIPYGLLADKWGRHKIIFLNTIGLLFYVLHSVAVLSLLDFIDIRWIWSAGLWFAVGGGPPVLVASIYAAVSDVTEPATRSQHFFIVGTVNVGANIVGPIIGVIAMQGGRWFGVCLGSGLIACCILIALVMPETRYSPIDPLCLSDAEEQEPQANDSWSAKARAMLGEVRSIARYQFMENKLLGLSLFSLIFTTFGKMLPLILDKYAHYRFDLSWEAVSLVTSIRSFVSLGVTAILLPLADAFLRKTLRLPLIHKDMWMVRASILFMFVGSVFVGLANTLPLYAAALVIFGLGCGYDIAMRGMLAHVAGTRVATVYTTMSLMENLGDLISGPLLAKNYRDGLRLGGVWIGLPFFVVAGLFGLAAVLVWCVRWNDAKLMEGAAPLDDQLNNCIH